MALLVKGSGMRKTPTGRTLSLPDFVFLSEFILNHCLLSFLYSISNLRR